MEPGELPPVAILAGGLATRLRPITARLPKALVEIAGQPFLYHQIVLLKQHGIRDIVLCVGYLGEMLQEQFQDGADLGVRLRYSFDGERLLGTAGALHRALPLLGDVFLVLYGDSYLTCDYEAVAAAFLRSGKLALMTVYRNDGQHDTSNIEFDRGEIIQYDKEKRTAAMRHIDYGLGVFRRDAFAGLPEDQPYDLAKIYQQLLRAGQLAAFEVSERFYEIGTVEGMNDTANFLGGTVIGHDRFHLLNW